MKRLPLLLSIVAVVIAVTALGLALLLRPSPLLVQRQVLHYDVGYDAQNNTLVQSGFVGIDLNAGDVLQGYASGKYRYVDYQLELESEDGRVIQLGSGYGGTGFCYVAAVTGHYSLGIVLPNSSSISQYHALPLSEDVPVVYWIQAGPKPVE